ncbi:ABC transporter ATP-binding protein [Pseudorhodobacter sp. E13]|uniref:energy-coupling factor ABC transporter ATP-binding protein n=1 Tax=Pseudorhodobacter sp. E13 TaxID=2487931 RepID=UPI000F8F2719|nr:ABC transporter ATP-binding protein [Pseudorhodobacter sp. E13]RUS58585.1 ABC transporter ATP-binding protein [Pseudorhodobacter sp. E13]
MPNLSPLSDDPGLILRDASFALSGRVILSGLDLHLTERRIGIIGRNGSGKTTFLRLLAGLIAPSTGSVTVGGVDPAKDRKAMLGLLGILFQNPDHQIIFPTVGEELAFGLRQQGLDKAAALAKTRALLHAHGRAHWEAEPVTALSQGQRHFLCLLSVLAMGPRTILLDEPFAGLDLPTQARLTRSLADLPQRLITITHDPAALQGYDRVIWLEAGRLRADGRVDAVVPAFTAEMARLGEADADTDLAL